MAVLHCFQQDIHISNITSNHVLHDVHPGKQALLAPSFDTVAHQATTSVYER